MVQAQGLRPPTPHQILQLDPAAPRSLVVEVYLTLSRRAARLGETAWLQELRRAYTLVMGRGGEEWPTSSDDRRDHYAVLRVDPAADEEIIQLANTMLPRLEPVAHRSVVRYLRDEAYRVLSNPQLRARYDIELRNATLTLTPRPPLWPVPSGRSEPRQEHPTVEKKRGLFGRGQSSDLDSARDARLLRLRDVLSVEPDAPTEFVDDVVSRDPTSQAEVIFTAGPREGMRVEVNGAVIPLGDGKSIGTLWRHGDRFMLRHNGKGVRIGGAAPSLSILVLEDGDEIAIGSDRAVFQILTLPPNA